MSLQESGEMYLETILVLGQRTGFVRAIDICDEMGYSKPSISRAVGILRQDGYILVGKDGGITLTDAGRAIAEKIYERHRLLSGFLMQLGVMKKPPPRTPAKWSTSSAMPPWRPSSATPQAA